MWKKKKTSDNGIPVSERIASTAENTVFNVANDTDELCEKLDKRMDDLQKKIDTKFLWRRKGDKSEKSTSD